MFTECLTLTVWLYFMNKRGAAFIANTFGRPGTIAEYNFGSIIGTTLKGMAASNVRVMIGSNGHVISAFPF